MEDSQPPVFKEGQDYEKWRSSVQMWQLSTAIEPRRQALSVRARLSGDLRKLALKLDAADLNTEDGMSFLLDKLDTAFKKVKRSKWDVAGPAKNVVSNNGMDSLRPQVDRGLSMGRSQPNIDKSKSNMGKPGPNMDRSGSSMNRSSGPSMDRSLCNMDSSRSNVDRSGHTMDRSRPNMYMNQSGPGYQNETPAEDPNMSAADKARLRALKLSAKLAAEGKYQSNSQLLLPRPVVNPIEQFKQINKPFNVSGHANKLATLPEVKRMENGGYFAEFEINDTDARAILTKRATHNAIGNQSGASLSLTGRYLNQQDKQKVVTSGEKPLTLMIQADVAAKVQVAVHKVNEIIIGPSYNANNTNSPATGHHFVQDKVFVGMRNVHPDFKLTEALCGVDGTNFNFIIQQTGAKVFLRGKGSGFMEQNSRRESFEALHIYISHPRQDGLETTREICHNLIQSVKNKYEEWETARMAPNTPPISTYQGMLNHLQSAYSQYPSYSQSGHPQPYVPPPPLMGQDTYYPPQQEHQSEPNTQFTQFGPPSASVESYRLPMNEYVSRDDQYTYEHSYKSRSPLPNDHHHRDSRSPLRRERHDNGHHNQKNSREATHYRDNERKDSRHIEEDNERRNRRGRSRERRHRSRSRSRSRSRERQTHNASSKTKSPDHTERPKSKRKFTEEPKKKRKFSEDPKLLENSQLEESKYKDAKDMPPPKLQFRSKKEKENKTAVEPFMLPPPLPPVIPMIKDVSKEAMSPPIALTPGSKRSKSSDVFKAPPPTVQIVKPKPTALKMGALSSLIAYDDDSDED